MQKDRIIIRNFGPIRQVAGEESYSVGTDENGDYLFSHIVPGKDYELAFLKGDDLGGLSPTDVSKIKRHAAGVYEMNCHEMIAADVSGDGTISGTDASKVIRYIAGYADCMNNECVSWTFTPEMSECGDWPPISYSSDQSYSPLDSGRENEDFVGMRLGDVTGNWTPGSESSEKRETRRPVNILEVDLEAGAELTVPIFLNQEKEIEGIDIVIEFDETLLKPSDTVFTGGILEGEDYGMEVITHVEGQMTLLIFAETNPPTLTGQVVSVNFDAVGSEETSSALTLRKFDVNESSAKGGFYEDSQLTIHAGNIDHLGTIDLRDAILALKVLAGVSPGGVHSDADIS